jgi:hypothetical protein
MVERKVTKRDITEQQFFAILRAAAQPINAVESEVSIP